MFHSRKYFSYFFVVLFFLCASATPALSFTHDCRRKSNEGKKTEQGSMIQNLMPLMLMLLMLFDKHNDSISSTDGGVEVEEIDNKAELDWDDLCANPEGGDGSGDGSGDGDTDGSKNTNDKNTAQTGDTTKGQSTESETIDICDNKTTLCDSDLGTLEQANKTVIGWTDALDPYGALSSSADANAKAFEKNLNTRIQSSIAVAEVLGQQGQTVAKSTKNTMQRVTQKAKGTRTLAVGKQVEASVSTLEMQTLAINNEVSSNELLLQSFLQAKQYRHILAYGVEPKAKK